jgi:hypothetical protein
MRLRTLALPALLITVLAGCSPTAPDETAAPSPAASSPEATASTSPEESQTPADEVTEDASVTAEGYPEACDTSAPAGTADSPVATAAASAEMPAGVTLRLGTQVIGSVDDPGMVEAVARICSEPLTADELTAVATTIAQAIYKDPSHETLTLLKVSSWVPDGAGSIKQEHSVDTDYELFLWDADPSLLPSNWTHNS